MDFSIDIPVDLSGQEPKVTHGDSSSQIFEPSLQKLDALLHGYSAFNIFFMALLLIESVCLALFLSATSSALVIACSLALLFFSLFAFFTLRLYWHTKKPAQIREIKEAYLSRCKELLRYQEDQPEHLTALANACCKLANRLHGREYDYYKIPFLQAFGERLGRWLHWEDIHYLKELLLQAAVEEHIKLVKCQPTELKTHATLANAYVMLSGLYIDPRKLEGYDDDRWIPPNKYQEAFQEQFRKTAQKAIEEFKILSEYAPDDPWVHAQLAYSYHDLQMPLEEIREYETIQRLLPDDKDNLFKLGVLYFQQGMNAKGLCVYEELKNTHYKKADSLLNHYGGAP